LVKKIVGILGVKYCRACYIGMVKEFLTSSIIWACHKAGTILKAILAKNYSKKSAKIQMQNNLFQIF
jgi:hypothetical protein